MSDDQTPDHHTVVARAVRDYLVTGEQAVLDALTATQRIDAERQIAAHREATRRETARGGTTPTDLVGAAGSSPHYGRQLLYISIGLIVALVCFWAVYTLPKLV